MSDLISRKEAIKMIKACSLNETSFNYYKTHLENVPAVQQWIPCSERLPEHMEEVLVCTGFGEPFIAWYSKINDIWRNASTEIVVRIKVLAWMPLPKPYKGE